MAIVLYGPGDTHTVQGIQCSIMKVEAEQFTGKPDDGWFLNPLDIYKVVEHGMQEEEQAEKEIVSIDAMKNEDIRSEAKNAGIADYKTARIQTLKNKLKA